MVTTVDTIELETKVKEMYRHVAQEPGGEWPCLAPIARTPTWPLTCEFGGAEGTRTPDPLHAMQMRYQLRHSPRTCRLPRSSRDGQLGNVSQPARPRRNRARAGSRSPSRCTT
jgi:hypothetical protein